MIKSIGIWLGMVLLAVGVVATLFPRIITGSYADITITDISVTTGGQYQLNYSALTAAHTSVINAFYDGDKYNGGGTSDNGTALWGWPSKGASGVMFTLDPESITEHRSLVPRPDRLLVKQGATYRLHAGERLYFFDYITADGVRHSGYVEVAISHQPLPPAFARLAP